MRRCHWVDLNDKDYVRYHDEEWGIRNFSDAHLFEMLILEMFQAGLSWKTILHKREAFKKAYKGFDIDKVIAFDEADVSRLLKDKGIIRNRRKIEASIRNAKVFKNISNSFGSFYEYLASFAGYEVIFECDKKTSTLSKAIASDLRKRGMSFFGDVICYSYLQAIGIIDSHEMGCFKHKGC